MRDNTTNADIDTQNAVSRLSIVPCTIAARANQMRYNTFITYCLLVPYSDIKLTIFTLGAKL